jgi:hypothetical protein
VLGALSVLALLSSPVSAPAAAQQLNVHGTKVKEAFLKLDAAWDMRIDGRPRLSLGWGILGGLVTGPRSHFEWSFYVRKGTPLSVIFTGDNSVTRIYGVLVNADKKAVIMRWQSDQSYASLDYTIPENGTYTVRVGRESINNAPAYMLTAYESATGATISKSNMQALAQNMGAAFTDATSRANALTVPANLPNLFLGSFKSNETKVIPSYDFVKGPWALAAGADGAKQTLNLTVKNDKGVVIARDPGDSELAYCVLANDAPKSRVELTSLSTAPRFCFLTAFKAK